MKVEKQESPLDYLPEAMVEEMLSKHGDVVKGVSTRLLEIEKMKEPIREGLSKSGLLKNINDILRQKSYPTTVGVDGTYAVIRQLSLDTVGISGVAVEGLIPPKETRRWEKPQHIINIFPVEHSPLTLRICSAIMFSYELDLAARAPHRVVFLDGSLTTQLIKIGQGLEVLDDAPAKLKEEFAPRILSTLQNYLKVLTSPRVDIMYVGIPKYTTRNEVLKILKDGGMSSPALETSDDKGLLSLALKPGDVVGPVRLSRPEDSWHLTLGESRKDQPALVELKEKIIDALRKLHVLYFKPSSSHPALRVEIGENIALNDHWIATLLEALTDQSGIPGVLEPYPLYIADLFAKHAYLALSELREAALNDVDRIVGASSDVYLASHDYRTEGGFE